MINKTRCILSINAIHCLENPVPWHNNRFNNEITNFINYNNKNIITTSNERMKNYILKNNDISENKILINRIGFSDINNYTSINRKSFKTIEYEHKYNFNYCDFCFNSLYVWTK